MQIYKILEYFMQLLILKLINFYLITVHYYRSNLKPIRKKFKITKKKCVSNSDVT